MRTGSDKSDMSFTDGRIHYLESGTANQESNTAGFTPDSISGNSDLKSLIFLF